MKGRKAAVLALVLGAALTCSGCSFGGLMEKAVDLITDTATGAEKDIVIEHSVEAKDVDKSLAVPVLNNDIAGASIGQAGIEVTLDATATASDGGLLTYQWYRNSVDSNGGGTAIDGATDPVYQPDTTTPGSNFYYVVVTNNHGEKVHMVTSATHEVEIWGEGSWQQNAEIGAYQYMIDGTDTFPADLRMKIGNKEFIFDADGYAVDEDGNYIDVYTGEPIAEDEPVEGTEETTGTSEEAAGTSEEATSRSEETADTSEEAGEEG